MINIWRTTGHCFWDPQCYCGPSVRVGAYEGKWSNFSKGPSHSCSSGSSNLLQSFLLLQNTIGIDILSIWQNPHTDSLTCSVRDTVVEKGKWKTLELPLPGKIESQKQYHISGGISEISAISKALKSIGVAVPISPLNSLLQLYRRLMDLEEW